MSLQYFEEKKYKIFFIKRSFYLNIVCKNILRDVGLIGNNKTGCIVTKTFSLPKSSVKRSVVLPTRGK